MFFMESVELICDKGEVEFLITQVIRPVHVSEPGQLQLKTGSPIPQKDNFMSSVRCFLSPNHFKSDGFLIKSNALLKIQYIEIKMCKFDHILCPFI